MAADVITRFKLETTQYDSKLRDAAKGLREVAHMAEIGGKGFKEFSQKQIEAARDFGQVESGANNLKDKVKDLVGSFNDAAKAYNALTKEQQQGDFGKALADSLTTLKGRIAEAKQELYSLGDATNKVKSGGGLFSGDKLSGMLQVFGGNLMTKGFDMAVGTVTKFVGEIGDAVTQGIELARQGEGIRIAFERLGRGDILDGLREATHGTVTDLELMKAAVKFNDFKLPVEELGTMLAFAQQKAKDTGQSVDYMVDSIVTGLGRKSLMILDNLGLSANEIKEKMEETGDMTKAVGEIIRDQMSKAGDYVETAADRAAQSHVMLQNKMEELGRKFSPLSEASNNFWTSMKIGILDIVGGPLTRLLNGLTEAGRMMNAYGQMGGSGKVGRLTSNLASAREGNRQSIYQQQQEQFWRYINPREQQIKDIRAWQSGDRNEALQKRIGAITDKYGSLDATKIQAEVDAAKKMLSDYQAAAKQILQPIEQKIVPTVVDGSSGGGSGKGGNTTITEEKDEFTEIIGLVGNAQERVSDLQRQISESWDEGEIARLTGELKVAQTELQRLKDIGKEKPMQQGLSGFNQQTMSAWMQGRQGDLAKAEYGSADYSSIMGNIADMNTIKTILEQSMKAGINAAQFDLSGLWEKVFDGDDIPDATWQAMVNKINEKLKEMKLEPISIEFKTGEIAKDGKIIKSSYKDAASAVNSLGSALSGLDDPGAKIAGTIAQAIANIALAFSSADLKEGESGNIWYWIAATAAGMATMISTISAIHSATGYQNGGVVKGYQRGGVVKGYAGGKPVMGYAGGGSIGSAISGGMITGSTYSNDQIPIMANAGEVVLTKAMQGNLASQLNEQGGGRINIVGELQGEKIVLVANRYFKRTGQGEIVTW